MNKLNKKDIIRLIILIVFLLAGITITIALWPYIRQLTTEAGRDRLLNRIESFGPMKYGVYVLAQVLQIVFAFVPGEPFEIISGVMFGLWGGFAMCMLATFLGTVCVYYIVKLLGKPFVDIIISEEKLSKFKFLQDHRRFEFIVFILFLIPGTPKDALTYFAPFTTLKPSRFFILSAVARIPSIISSVIVGSTLNNGNLFLSVLVLIITAAIGIVGIWYNNKLMQKLEKNHSIMKAKEKKKELKEKLQDRLNAHNKK